MFLINPSYILTHFLITDLRPSSPLPNHIKVEADLFHLVGVEDQAAVEEEGGFFHVVVNALPVEGFEFVPLGHDGDGVRILAGFVGIAVGLQVISVVVGRAGAEVVEVGEHLRFVNFGVVDADVGTVFEELVGDVDGGRFAGVVGVFFEGPAEQGDLFGRHGVEERGDDFCAKALFLVVVHADDLFPVAGDVGQAEVVAEVYEVEDVFLEAGAAESDGGFEEFGADARVGADGAGDFFDVGAGGFAEGRNAVDAADALGEEGVGGEFGEFGAPDVGGEEAFAGDPGGVDLDEGFGGCAALFGLFAANEDTVGVEQVLDGGAFGEEFGVGEDLVFVAVAGCAEDAFDGFGGADWEGGFFDDDFVAVGFFGDLAGAEFDEFEVGGFAFAYAVGFGGRVDADEDHVGGADGSGDVGGVEEVFASDFFDDGLEAGFVDREVGRVPGVDAFGVDVDDVEGDVGVFLGHDGHGWAADVACADAGDGSNLFLNHLGCYVNSWCCWVLYSLHNPASVLHQATHSFANSNASASNRTKYKGFPQQILLIFSLIRYDKELSNHPSHSSRSQAHRLCLDYGLSC